jgi:hypothetical protein
MHTVTVDSTTLARIAYDSANQFLWLEFRNHALYCYFEVPPAVHQALIQATSKGAYFNQTIRGRFSYRRETDGQPKISS